MEEISVVQSLKEVATNTMEVSSESLEKCQKEKQEIDGKCRKVMVKYSATIAKFTEWQHYDNLGVWGGGGAVSCTYQMQPVQVFLKTTQLYTYWVVLKTIWAKC